MPQPLPWQIPGVPLPQLADMHVALVQQLSAAVAMGGAPGDVFSPAFDKWLTGAIAAVLALGGVA